MSAYICTLLATTTIVWLAVAAAAEDVPVMTACSDIVMVTRAEWGAREPRTSPVPITVPVNMTFIHHSAGQRSSSPTECMQIVRDIQNFHMDVRGWNDIAYSFLVCEDGRVYEGRGWNIEGAHTLGYNRIALGFCFVGDFTNDLPLPVAIATGKNLLQCGIDQSFIVPHFELFGHRDGRVGTECPGDALYALIRTWPNYSTRQIHKYGNVPTSIANDNNASSNVSPPAGDKQPNAAQQLAGEQRRPEKL
jgi:N-acetylmuramoyl-L-alanine amidase